MALVVDPSALRTLAATLTQSAALLASGDCQFDGNRLAATWAHPDTQQAWLVKDRSEGWPSPVGSNGFIVGADPRAS